jgi:hypothetical protein
VVTRRRPVTAALAGGLLTVGLAGCVSEGATPTPLDVATGAVLADAADRLADALDADDPCRAVGEADALRERAERALEVGDAPESVVEETIRVVDATTGGLDCDLDDGDVPDDEDADGEDADGGDADGDDADGDDADDPEPTAESGSSEPARTDTGTSSGSSDPAPTGSGSSGGDGGGGGGGPSGDGPPGRSGGGPPANPPGRGGGRP